MRDPNPLDVDIRAYRPEDLQRFAELNREWLVTHGILEAADEEQLADPYTHFIAPGGQILSAVCAGRVVGSCGVAPYEPGALELVKLAVDPAFRGCGLGRRLVERCIAYAHANGAQRLVLISSSKLQAALRLYESLGFVPRPLPVTKYATADIYMELEIGT